MGKIVIIMDYGIYSGFKCKQRQSGLIDKKTERGPGTMGLSMVRYRVGQLAD